ncbi:MAG: hypothetical protein ACRD51_17720, partial [Candidatus Acidiferrum sp.]
AATGRKGVSRPVSITVIALWLFLGAALELRTVLFRPLNSYLLTVFGVHLLRYAAVCGYLALMPVRICLGVGLLDRKPWARIGGIIFCVYIAVNSVVTFMMPGSFRRFLAGAEANNSNIRPDADAMSIFRDAHLLSVILLVGIAFAAIYFLVTRRSAFYGQPLNSASPDVGSASIVQRREEE